jgi:long-chain fatty acid transport protein
MAPARSLWGAAVCALLFFASHAQAQGVFLTGVGPINQSMGGAGTAAPLDSIGALNWNPASISGLRNNEMGFGLGLVLPTETLSSSVNPGALGGGFPPVRLAGSSGGEPGVMPAPTIGFVQRAPNSQWSYGLGIFGVGGFAANYASSPTNPILSPQAPLGVGAGSIYSQAAIYQIVPTVSYAVNDNLSFGFAPMITMAQVFMTPLTLAPPNDANHDGFYSYGPGNATRFAWGGGFQVGTYYISDSKVHFGVSVKSPQWMEPFRYNSVDELGQPVVQKVNFNLPTIVSLGTAYSGFQRTVLALDVRYWDYGNALGFNGGGFLPNGAVGGLGWRSVWSVSTGAQYDLTQRFTVRAGYTYGANPVPSSLTMLNVASSLINQNWLSMGASWRFTQRVVATLAYTHGFQNSITGPFLVPAGAIPGTSVTSTISSDILNGGLTVLF